LALLPSVAWSEDVQTTLRVVAAEVFQKGARVILESEVSLPEGRHQIELLLPPEIAGDGRFNPTVVGATVRSAQIAENTRYDPSVFDTAAQAAARASLSEAEEAARAAERAFDIALGQIAGLDAAGEFLRSVRVGGALPAPQDISEMASLIGSELGRQAADITALRAELPALGRAVDEAEASANRARAALAALAPPTPGWQLATLDVELVAPGVVTLAQEIIENSAGWTISYEMRLAEDAPVSLRLARSVTISHGSALPWIEADITLSTAEPTGQIAPSDVGRSIARVMEGGAVQGRPRSELATAQLSGAVREDQIAVAPAMFPAANFDTPVVSYELVDPVTFLAGQSEIVLSLDTLTFEADRYIAASPRFDETAFVVADFTNDGREPILPGRVRLFRDETLVADSVLPAIPAGADASQGFGPEPSVSLEVAFLDQQEGDRGIIRGQQTREDAIRITARNLGPIEQDVRLRYAVPTAQQEELDIRVEMAPEPDIRDADDLLGVMEWRLPLAPGSAEEIALGFELRWPEGQALLWRP